MSLEELRLLNGFIGFCIPSGGNWPTPFAEAEYEVTGIEHEIDTMVDGFPFAPVPELITSSSKAQHCVILEAKSGSVKDRQAKAYAAVTVNQLVVAGLAASEVEIARAEIDVLYMTSRDNSMRLSADLGRAGVHFPLIASDSSSFQLLEGSIHNATMHRVFAESLAIDEAAWPMHFVRCDRDSGDGELAAICTRKMVALLLRNGQFDIDQLASEAIDFWDRRGSQDQRRLKVRLASLVNEAEQTEFRGEIERVRPHRQWLRSGRSGRNPQSIDRLSELARQFVQRKEEGRPFKADQPPLFEYGPDE